MHIMCWVLMACPSHRLHFLRGLKRAFVLELSSCLCLHETRCRCFAGQEPVLVLGPSSSRSRQHLCQMLFPLPFRGRELHHLLGAADAFVCGQGACLLQAEKNMAWEAQQQQAQAQAQLNALQSQQGTGPCKLLVANINIRIEVGKPCCANP